MLCIHLENHSYSLLIFKAFPQVSEMIKTKTRPSIDSDSVILDKTKALVLDTSELAWHKMSIAR